MAFCIPKACGGVGGDVGDIGRPFLFAIDIGFSPVGRQTGSPSDQPADDGGHLCHIPGGLVEG